jgi:hypothetical protein
MVLIVPFEVRDGFCQDLFVIPADKPVLVNQSRSSPKDIAMRGSVGSIIPGSWNPQLLRPDSGRWAACACPLGIAF